MKGKKIKNLENILKLLLQQVKQFKLPAVDFLYSSRIGKNKKFNDFQILVSIILSSRTNDNTTLKSSLKLFEKVSNCDDLNKLSLTQIQKLIYPVGFYKVKAKNLKKLCRTLKKLDYKIPETIEELIKLEGVGRKTANLYISTVLKKPAICVDTHVHKILNRIGYLKTINAHETEMFLRENIDKKYWRKINFILVLFGQNICRPIGPKCDICKIRKHCNFYARTFK